MTRARFLLVLAAAALLAAALVGASLLSAPDGATAAKPAADVPRAFAGLPQAGAALGSPDAPVTLVEYADLQCPFCAEWAARTLPTLVADYVRSGELRIVFRGLAFLGPDSGKALDAALAAGRHGRLWDVVDGLYRRQGAENAGWVTDDLLDEVAADAGLDGARLRDESKSPLVDAERGRNDRAAQAAGVTGTPSFQLGRTGVRLELVQLRSLGPDGLVPAIDALLAR
jgi:protein-disulfide isomerase